MDTNAHSVDRQSCCSLKTIQANIKAYLCHVCGMHTCLLHSTIWTDNRVHCIKCFSSISEPPKTLPLITVETNTSSCSARCLVVIDGLYIAGAQKSVLSLILTLRQFDIGVHLLSLRGGGQWFDKFASVCDVISISYNDDVLWSELVHATGYKEPNIISSHLCEPSIWAATRTPSAIPLIVHLHSELSEHEKLSLEEADILFSRAKYLAVPSSATLDFYIEWACNKISNKAINKFVVVPNIIYKSPLAETKRAKLSSKDNIILLSPTRLDKDKLDIDMLFSFLLKLPFYKSVRLVIAGDGECRQDVEQFIFENKLGSFVTLLGFQVDMEEHYLKSHLVILFSKREAMPMVLLEAVFYGLPLVAPQIGVFEKLGSCQGIFLFGRHDSEELLLAVERAINAVLTCDRIYQINRTHDFFDIDNYHLLVGKLYSLHGDEP